MIAPAPTQLIPADGQPITTVAELNEVLVQAAGKTSGAHEIDLSANAMIALTTQLEAINLHSGVTLVIEGNGATLDGQNGTRGLFVYSGNVTVEDLTIQNTVAHGGNGGSPGGGGGAGLGGGLYVANDTQNGAAAGSTGWSKGARRMAMRCGADRGSVGTLPQ